MLADILSLSMHGFILPRAAAARGPAAGLRGVPLLGCGRELESKGTVL